MVEPKAKRKCKIKKKKEKAVTFEKLAIISKVMVHGDLLEDEGQSFKKLEEEVTMTPSHKREEKEREGWGQAKQRFSTREEFFPYCLSKGGIETSQGSLTKKPPTTPKKNKEKEKILNLSREPPMMWTCILLKSPTFRKTFC